ncbi:hypothetical protein GCM10009819_16640 [Agromyces tropicus]|uniref:N-acetyltransferase n=1 Tax=Agromyces tropicus TaxID=555371 RepID=A0ABP5FSU1_9MICO
MSIRGLVDADWPGVAEVFRQGIATGDATFEPEPPDWTTFDATRVERPRLVAVEGDLVLGWAAAVPVSARRAYRGVIEHSVYWRDTVLIERRAHPIA